MTYDLKDRIRRINADRAWRAQQGEPGDPPNLLCEVCGFVECMDGCSCESCDESINDPT